MMKSYHEISDDIRKERESMQELNEKKKTLENACFPSWENFEEYKKIKESTKDQRAELDSIYENIVVSELRIKYLKHNAKHALYNEVLPVLLDLLKKYEGKAAGPKTCEKISDALKTATGCRAHFGRDYGAPYVNVYPENAGYNERLEIHTRYNTPDMIDGENRFNVPAVENVYLGHVNKNYFKDIDATIKEARAAMARADKALNELKEACSTFNVYAVEGIEHATIYDLRTIRNKL